MRNPRRNPKRFKITKHIRTNKCKKDNEMLERNGNNATMFTTTILIIIEHDSAFAKK